MPCAVGEDAGFAYVGERIYFEMSLVFIGQDGCVVEYWKLGGRGLARSSNRLYNVIDLA